MTLFYSVIIDEEVMTIAHPDEAHASLFEEVARRRGYDSHAFGNVNGDIYLIVYTKGADQ